MMIPTVAEERAMALRLPSGWRRASLITQVVLFVLTCVAIAALFWLADLLNLPKGWITAILSIALAELLIVRARFWRTGVEAALWIGGLCAFIFALPSSGKPEAILTFVAAAAIAGWRVRNALFGAAALVLIAVYLVEKDQAALAAAFAGVVALAALVAETRPWQRPSTELLCAATLIVMPVTAYGALAEALLVRSLGVAALFVALAVVFTEVGIHLRLRAALLAAAVAVAIAGVEAARGTARPLEQVLIVAGVLVLASAAALIRALRGQDRGFTLAGEPAELDEALQIAAMIPLAAPAAQPTPAPHTPGAGGEFGGAGASGKF